jgi:hypothetical protein
VAALLLLLLCGGSSKSGRHAQFFSALLWLS